MGNFFEEAANVVQNPGRAANDLVQGARSTLQGVGNISRQNLGSFGYLGPLGPHQLAADYFNQEDKKKQAEAEAEAARQQLQGSVSAADRVRAQQGVFAADLKKNALRDVGLLTNQAASNERRAMAENIRNAKLDASSRGLLGSGFQKSQEAGARASAAANTASKERQIQELYLQQIQDAEDLQAQLGLETGGLQQNMADQYYQMAIQNMQKRNQSYSDILGAGARLGGTYLGSRNGLGKAS